MEIYYLNPHLVIEEIDIDIFIVSNPIVRNCLKILNKKQLHILSQFDGKISNLELFRNNNLDKKQGQYLLSLFLANKYISKNTFFSYNENDNNISKLSLWIHTSNDCNLDCSYCYINKESDNLSFNKARIRQLKTSLVNTVYNNNISNLTLRFAGGEPFLKYQIWDEFLVNIKSELKEFNCNFKVVFLTNLVLCDDNVLSFIKKHNIGIGVSLDGKANFHDKTRYLKNGTGSFKLIENNLNKMISQKLKPHIMTVVSNDNLEGLYDFTRYLFNKRLTFRFSIVHGEVFDYIKATKVFNQIFKYLEDKISEGYDIDNILKIGELKPVYISKYNCGAGISSGAIYPDGRLYFCQKQVGSNEELGNIYTNNDLFSLLKKGKIYNKIQPNRCMMCSLVYICSNGCPLNQDENFDQNKCDFYKSIISRFFILIGKGKLHKIMNS